MIEFILRRQKANPRLLQQTINNFQLVKFVQLDKGKVPKVIDPKEFLLL